MNRRAMMEKYARLAVSRGVHVQKGQLLVIRANVRDAEFVRLCAEEAYRLGAGEVSVDWRDDRLSLLGYQFRSSENLSNIPQWIYDKIAMEHERSACYLSILSDAPDVLKNADMEKVQIYQKAYREKTADLDDYLMSSKGQWCVIGLASPAWAKLVFPDIGESEAVEKLQEEIWKVSRIKEESDPEKEWEEHDQRLMGYAEKLNAYQFDSLHFSNKLGTDLTVGLVRNHIWVGGGEYTPSGIFFVPNIPTEEVFCMPDRSRVEGKVFASRPLSYQGSLIDGFSFVFHEGKVTEFSAEKGENLLQSLLDFDEGSRYLGEVALVPWNSPIAQSGVLFYNTLYDENAACHLALGRPYPENLKGGVDMTEEQLKEAGANASMQHEDFMFGTEDLEVDGITLNGESVPVFRNGNFVI